MDADFSIRNEVESLQPPHVGYSHDESPYDDIISGIRSAPPFPAAPIDLPYASSSCNSNPYESVIRQQAWLIRQQQDSIAKLVSSTSGKNSVDWKYIVLCLGLAVFFLLLQNNSSRRNPRIERVSGYIDDLAGFDY